VSILAACSAGEKPKGDLGAFPVRTTRAERAAVEERLVVVGSLKARDEATLFSRVPGKLARNLAREGDRVRKDQAVALVERDEVGVKFEPAPVPSTLDGIVARVYLDRGADVTLVTPVALVVDQAVVLARADVPERYAGRIRPGQPVRLKVDAWPGRTFEGRVIRVSPVVDATTRTTYVEASLPNGEGLLKSGMFCELSVVLERKEGAILVPAEALANDGGAVFVRDGANARRVAVQTGLRDRGRIEILSGLTEGAEVITFGNFSLKDGSPVEVIR
jgi:multidrug efflux pump subunit AcrA (membrane-fusion protein)